MNNQSPPKSKFVISQLILYRLKVGLPSTLVPLMRFILLDYSKPVADYIETNYELHDSRDEYEFVSIVVQMMPILWPECKMITLDQFYDVGTSEAKLKFLLDIIKLVKKKDKEVRDCVKLFHFRSSVNFRMKESLLEQDLMSNSEHEN